MVGLMCSWVDQHLHHLRIFQHNKQLVWLIVLEKICKIFFSTFLCKNKPPLWPNPTPGNYDSKNKLAEDAYTLIEANWANWFSGSKLIMQ